MAVASGIIVAWPSTNASIPSGWTRETGLDGLYPKGWAGGATTGSTGGSNASHLHGSSNHNHSTAHTHTVPTSSGGTGTTARDTGTTRPPVAHTHTSSDTVNPTTTLSNEAPNSSSSTAEPQYYEVIFIKSDGTPTGIPANAVAFWYAASAPGSWNLCDGGSGRPDMRSRFLKGAATSGDAGGTGGATTHTHTNDVASHSHGGTYAHTHPDVTSNATAAGMVGGNISGSQAATATQAHTHVLTIASGSPAVTAAAGGATGSYSNNPQYRHLAFIQNNTGADSLPDKIIAMWMGDGTAPPTDWKVCDYNLSGGPDMVGNYAMCPTTLSYSIGGSNDPHTHGVGTHTHPIAAHTHAITGAAGAGSNETAGAVNCSTTTHTHTWAASGSASATSGTATPSMTGTSIEPAYKTVAYIQYFKNANGSVSKTLGALTSSSAGTVAVAGSVSKTLGAATLSSAGTVVSPPAAGSLSKTLGVLTSTAAGKVEVKGSTSKTLGAVTLSSAGTVVWPPISGSLSKTLGALTRSITGTVDVKGSVSKTLGALTSLSFGIVDVFETDFSGAAGTVSAAAWQQLRDRANVNAVLYQDGSSRATISPGAGDDVCGAIVDTDFFGSNQFVEFQADYTGTGNERTDLFLHSDGYGYDNGQPANAYVASLHGNSVELNRIVGGTATQLGTTSDTLVPDDKYLLQTLGDNIMLFKNGALLLGPYDESAPSIVYASRTPTFAHYDTIVDSYMSGSYSPDVPFNGFRADPGGPPDWNGNIVRGVNDITMTVHSGISGSAKAGCLIWYGDVTDEDPGAAGHPVDFEGGIRIVDVSAKVGSPIFGLAFSVRQGSTVDDFYGWAVLVNYPAGKIQVVKYNNQNLVTDSPTVLLDTVTMPEDVGTDAVVIYVANYATTFQVTLWDPVGGSSLIFNTGTGYISDNTVTGAGFIWVGNAGTHNIQLGHVNADYDGDFQFVPTA